MSITYSLLRIVSIDLEVIMKGIRESGTLKSPSISHLNNRLQEIGRQIGILGQEVAILHGKGSLEQYSSALTKASKYVISSMEELSLLEGKTKETDTVAQQQGPDATQIVDPDSKDSYGPALTQIIRSGNERLAIKLLEKGADPDSQDVYGTAITQAIRGRCKILVKALLDKGANPNSKDSFGPALTQAIRSGDENLAINVLERGADPKSRDTYGPALTQAIRAGYTKLAVKLLECGAE